jgi:hypothetical protein
MPRLLPILAIFSVLLSCQSGNSLSETDKQAITEEIRQTLHQYYADIEKSGLTAELRYLDSSDNFFWVPPGFESPISYDSVVSHVRYSAPLFPSIVNKWDTLRIIPHTKELASYTGKLRSTFTDTTGITETHLLIETGVVIKRKDGWKLLNGQTATLQ